MFKTLTWLAFGALAVVGWLCILPVVKSGRLENGNSFFGQNFATVAAWHVLLVFALAWLASRRQQLAAQAGAELVKLTGYLYTLAGMILLLYGHSNARDAAAPVPPEELLRQMLPYLGSGLVSSLLGWFLAAMLDVPALDKAIRFHIAPTAGGSQAGTVLPPDLLEHLHEELRQFSAVVSASGQSVRTAAQGLPQTIDFATKAAELVAAVQTLLLTDAARREALESELNDVKEKLAEIKTTLEVRG